MMMNGLMKTGIKKGNTMYALEINIYTDGDFGYTDSEFYMKDDETIIFYFEKRESAITALERHLESVSNSIFTSDKYLYRKVKNWYKTILNKFDLIKKEYVFKIYKSFGNSEVEYCLFEVEKKKLDNGSFYFSETKRVYVDVMSYI